MKRTRWLILAVLTLAVHLDAAPKWSRLDTPNFIVIGTGSVSSLRELGKQFEGFREALTRLLSSAVTSTPVPTVVIAFPDDKSFEPFRPVYNGKPVELAGLFMPRSAVNYILLGPNHGMEELRPVFHEYTHLMVSNVAPVLPVWLNEGIAEYYSTFEMDKGGRTVLFGKPIAGHFQELSQGRWMPLDALLAVERDSPEYNEGSRRGVFYAESWMLVHMLLNGQTDRQQAFAAYLRELGAGAASKDAWQHNFGRDDVYRALREYATRQTVTMRQYKPSDQIVFASGVAVPISIADVECTMGEVLAAQQKTDPAMQRFDRALAAAPGSARAAVGKAAAQHHAPALPATPDASPDWFSDYMVGSQLLESRETMDRASSDAARAALTRAAAVRGEIPNLQVLLAMAAERTQEDPTLSVTALMKAHAAAPVRDDYSVFLARALARAGRFAEARGLLGSIMAHPYQPGGRDFALATMKQIVTAEQFVSRGSKASDAIPPDVPATDGPPQPERVRWVFRELKDGEQRTEGQLERIDCAGKRVDFAVRTADGVVHFHADAFDRVEFITYRTDLQGMVNCAPRTPPDHVYVSWKPGDPDGIAVAIEFLPTGMK
jgi:hypothetical protein